MKKKRKKKVVDDLWTLVYEINEKKNGMKYRNKNVIFGFDLQQTEKKN